MQAPSPSPITMPAAARARRLLVVEDEPLIAMTMADQLEGVGYTVPGPTFTMAGARQLAAVEPIDAALIDCIAVSPPFPTIRKEYDEPTNGSPADAVKVSTRLTP
jgi:hypothetical protein